MQQIGRGLFYETSHIGVTLGCMVFANGIILIDAPLRSEDTRSWRSTIFSQRGGANRLLVTLDPHPDRTLGARSMDCTIIAHQKAAQVFRNRPTIFKGQTSETGAAWEGYSDAVGMRWALPDITFAQKMSLHWGGPEVVLEHHPGPAQGSIWAIVPSEKVVFVGDAVVVDQPPFFSAADMSEWIETLELLQGPYAAYTIVSGRGGTATQAHVREQLRIIKSLSKDLDKLAKKNTAPESTEDMVDGLLAEFTFPDEQKTRYAQRLRYGLNQYFTRRYRPVSATETFAVEEEEEEQ